jgi:hypothetical protein
LHGLVEYYYFNYYFRRKSNAHAITPIAPTLYSEATGFPQRSRSNRITSSSRWGANDNAARAKGEAKGPADHAPTSSTSSRNCTGYAIQRANS